MDYKFLPEVIKTKFPRPEGAPDSPALRGTGGFSGKPGESYLLLAGDSICLFERNYGQHDFQEHILNCRDPNVTVKLEAEKLCTLLHVGTFSMKLSAFESEAAELLLKEINTKRRTAKPAGIPPTPYHLLIMMLIDIGTRSAKDKKLPASAEKFIADEICSGNTSLFHSVRQLYENGKYEAMLSTIRLNETQKRCILGNILEMAMRDGSFSSAEQKLAREAAGKIGIGSDELKTIWNVILDKNCLSCLTAE